MGDVVHMQKLRVKVNGKVQGLKGTHEERLEAEIERQRNIYRPGTTEILLRRAAVRALIERGEW